VVFEIRLLSKSPMLYRPALHGNWNALSLANNCFANSSGISAVSFIWKWLSEILTLKLNATKRGQIIERL
jgi:hypothetical protein